ncbi:MAG: hypothetical protein H8K06_12335 [Nitrospira sp.]|uniref:Uncharacterized protein n=1 Tax=Nitrospira defluvii TaxID=330214 RepID=A0ABM8RUT2_9BACT|nr:hypothetical protein [Nitrospira defluvii]MCS6327861.1 hypothetical protein [Nitrospira sp.]CAE6772840.1 conserved hypothetical protein [Nitrospira defluvii]
MPHALTNSPPVRTLTGRSSHPARTILVLAGRALLCWSFVAPSPAIIGTEALAAADQPQPSTTDKVLRDTKEAVESTKQYTLQQKEAFQKTFQAELTEMQGKIAELQKKTNAASVEARSEMQKALQDLERKKNEARKQLDDVSQSTSSGWSKLKENLSRTLDDLKQSYKETVSKLP